MSSSFCMPCFALLLTGSLLSARASRPTPRVNPADKLTGWLGDTFNPDIVFGDFADERKKGWSVQVAERPRAFVYHNFLTDDEVNHILEVSAPQMRRSTVVGQGGNGVVDNIRTSYGTFIRRLHDPVIARIEQKIAEWTNTTIVQQEDIQVLRYVDGQKYGAHLDGLGRLATVVMFLVDTEEGGETIFPNSEWLDPSMADGFQDVSDCARGHVGLKPKRGTAVLFYDMLPDGTMDEHSMHTACPVIKGVKWSAPVWIHPQPFRPEDLKRALSEPANPPPDPGLCEDHHPKCATWKQAGECERNSAYMIGDDFALGACRATCGACEACAGEAQPCYKRNRERAGYLDLFQEIENFKTVAAMSGAEL